MSSQSQAMLFSLIQTCAAENDHETEGFDRLFLDFFNGLSRSQEYSSSGPDRQCYEILQQLKKQPLQGLTELAKNLGLSEKLIEKHEKRVAAEVFLMKAISRYSNNPQDYSISADLCPFQSTSATTLSVSYSPNSF